MKKIFRKGHPSGRRKRYLAFLMSLCLSTAMVPIPVRAESSKATGLCEHHTKHTLECGYVEAVEGQECEHMHDEDCGYQEAGECTHVHTEDCGEEGENCTHEHDRDCGYAKEQKCGHTHDEKCGYLESVKGSPCTFVCDRCDAEAEKGSKAESEAEPEAKSESGAELESGTETESESEAGAEESSLSETALAVQELIDALPDAEDITEENLEEVSGKLDEIDEAKTELSDEEREALDTARYDAAADKIAKLLGEEGAGEPQALALSGFDMTGQPADAKVKTINLNAAVLRPTDANNKQWDTNGNKVYFGKYNGSATAYRVLASPNTQEGVKNCILLDCDSVLEKVKFNNYDKVNPGQTKKNEWANSDLQNWLKGSDFYGDISVFSTLEKNVIKETTLSEQNVYTAGENYSYQRYKDYSAADHVFCLSAAEAEGLYKDGDARKKTGGTRNYWWLRSANLEDGSPVGVVYSAGDFHYQFVTANFVGVSPAFNVNLSSVLFAAESGMDKTSALSAVSDSTDKEWKLTLLDGGKTVYVTSGESVTKTDNGGSTTITVSYTYSDNNTANAVTQISIMLTDKAYTDSSAQVLYYGALQGVAITAGGASGKGTFTLPDDLAAKTYGKDYCAYIIAEDVNGSKESDYASAPVQISIPNAIETDTDNGAGAGTDTDNGKSSGKGTGSGKSSSTGTATETAVKTESTENTDTAENADGVYQILEGADASWTDGSEGLTVRGSGEFDKFLGLKVDGLLVDTAYYTVAEGSTIVTLNTSCLNTLEAGTHTLEILWTDGSAVTTFTVSAHDVLEKADGKKDEVPKTGEGTTAVWMLILAVLSGMGVILSGRKKGA